MGDVFTDFLRSVAKRVCGGGYVLTTEKIVCSDGRGYEYVIENGRLRVCGVETDVGIIMSDFGAYLLELVVKRCLEG